LVDSEVVNGECLLLTTYHHSNRSAIHLHSRSIFKKRRHDRVGFFCKVGLAEQPHSPGVPARTLDLSLSGARLLTHKAFAVGDQLILSFYLRDDRQREVVEKISGRVINCRADMDVNRIGVAFNEQLSESQQPNLVKKLANVGAK
jgi:hypothetical protein